MKHSSESGNAIVLVFIAIALFAALGFAFSSGSRTSTALLTDEQKTSVARQIIAYGNDVRQAVKRLKLRGCADTEISFENPIVSGYTNPNSPADKSCHVFDVAGGGISWQTPSESWLEADQTTYNSYQEYYFSNVIRFLGFGDDCAADECVDLLIELPHIKPEICDAINLITGTDGTAGNSSIVNHFYQETRKFIGEYDYQTTSVTSTIGDTETFLIGKSTGCHVRGGWTAGDYPYVYYQVILSR